MRKHKFIVTREPGDLSGPESIVATWAHTDPAIARQRAVSHCKRLQRMDAPLSHSAIYRVRDEEEALVAIF